MIHKLFIFITLLCCNTGFCFCNSDTSDIKKSDYKLSRKEYLKKYAETDSTLAEAINLYFDKRKKGVYKVVALPFGIIISAATITTFATTENATVKRLSSYGVVFGVIASMAGVPHFLHGIRILKKYNRKELYYAIEQIKAGHLSSQDFYNKVEQY
ncbi:MAG: hypothetical protein U0V72_03985 [Cytophagales bacterium]